MKSVLYLGLDPSRYQTEKKIIHYPIITILPLPFEECKESFKHVKNSTHVILTSQNGVRLFFEYARKAGYSTQALEKKTYIAVGKATSWMITNHIDTRPLCPSEECQEGVIKLIDACCPSTSVFFYPHSKLSRELLSDYLQSKAYHSYNFPLYNTAPSEKRELNWEEFDEIVFTSSSTVEAFFLYYGPPPSNTICTAIGPITQDYLMRERLQKKKFVNNGIYTLS